MRDIKEEIIKWVRTSFANITWRKVLTFSFFILLATGLWFLQIYRQPFETTLHVPVKYTNIPDSIIFDHELPESVSIRIKDGGAEMFRYFFSKRHDTLSIDVGQIINSTKSNVLQGLSLEEILRTKLYSSSEIKSYSPSRISLDHAALVHKKVPVIFDGEVVIEPGYLLAGDIKMIPDSITIYGSEATLSGIEYIYTMNDTIKGITSPQTLSIDLIKGKNVRFSPSSIKLEVPVDQYNEKTVTVPIVCTNLPTDLDIKIFPSTAHVSFLVGQSKYKDVSDADFLIELDYNTLKDLKNPIVPIRLTLSPSYIDNVSISPYEVEFVFEKKVTDK
ncbi:YbbR-like domain-containing protein [Dysgonomonas sp. 520]|uniref:YbbR-like domain-containing protein n=1 Tax=Dysgonomonas sp. 520 TaxID=2302931 RepID=UPI0013D5AE74|nr:YbbR-like domain-containing protein [Dysgonomonas sp. 520]NDW09880.1 YbbR-like domain-containing protein [Dysgonomonas sp. 520]